MLKKLLVLAVFAAALFAFFHYDLGSQLTLENLKAQQDAIDSRYRANPLVIIGIFFFVYVAVTALSIPGAAVMTLAAGALFGVVVGTVVVSFASTIGATIAFLTSRYLLGDWVESKFGQRLKNINEGIKRDGAFYLISIRLVPAFPFFVVNMLMGLTKIRVGTYFIASQIGMLAGTIVFVNAGTQLSQVNSVGEVFSLPVIGSFVLLAIFPWIAKAIIGLVKNRKIYQGWTKPKKFDRNLIVIGAGSGGLVSSLIAATINAKVTLIEAGKMGGDCLNYGCVPSKALIKSAKIAEQMQHADRYGLTATTPNFDFKNVINRVENIIKTIEPHDSVERYEGLGVDVVQGYAKLIDPWTVEIARNDGETQVLTGKAIVLATGARPFVPPLPGLENTGYLTSDTLWEEMAKRDAVPKKMVVLGGGPIGCELSQSFARLGSEVTLVEMADRVMGIEDQDVSDIAAQSLTNSGVNLLCGHKAIRTEMDGTRKMIIVENDDGEHSLPFDELLIAVGRAARLEGFGLEKLGIETDRTLVTNEHLQTTFPHIYAAGDVAGPYQLTHNASHQAWFATVNALFGRFKKFKPSYEFLPWTTFLDPEIAHAGLNEQQAEKEGIEFEVTKYGLDDLDRAIAESATEGFVKVLTPPGKDRILGVTIVGQNAGELLTEYVLAMKHGLGLGKIMGTIHTYPTMAEANKFAAGEWRKKHKPEWALQWLKRYFNWARS
ncbi:MAG: FAD-dependent oxidoreductase [Parasphingorhabdus sp.]|uniref:FAD-dependent oxidoreductase n=1 Tax=Parasphingorhabdus sp. TaxID=2709688 RepID=UPI003297AD55